MNAHEPFDTIAALDLKPIKEKLMQQSGEGWPLAQATAVESEYRRFLCLMKLYPNEQVSPLADVDIFWHYHILDTMKYAADCEQVFGYFLHHVPSGEAADADGEADHDRMGARMQELYDATFGDRSIRARDDRAIREASRRALAKNAWCAPAAPTTAWCAPAAPTAAWCAPATKTYALGECARTPVQNDSRYSRRPVALAA